jgi:hypothetical protein
VTLSSSTWNPLRKTCVLEKQAHIRAAPETAHQFNSRLPLPDSATADPSGEGTITTGKVDPETHFYGLPVPQAAVPHPSSQGEVRIHRKM